MTLTANSQERIIDEENTRLDLADGVTIIADETCHRRLTYGVQLICHMDTFIFH